MQHPYTEYYKTAGAIATQLQAELTRLQRWQDHSLPDEAFQDMGAFGSNTMSFEQWIQFILIPTIHEIIQEGGNFPADSQLATYAVRVWDGDHESGQLQTLLHQLDQLITEILSLEEPEPIDETSFQTNEMTETTIMGSSVIPTVVYQLMEVLPGFEGQDLEDQLNNYDIFLSYLSPEVRPAIADMLWDAAQKCTNPLSKIRIERASLSVRAGGAAAGSSEGFH